MDQNTARVPNSEDSPTIDRLTRLFAGPDDARAAPDVAVIVAHPDDETVSLGAQLPRLRHATFVCVTDGAPRDLRDARAAGFATRQAYARARRDELHRALHLAGIDAEQVCLLDVVDQEASRALSRLVQTLRDLLHTLRPEVVITHPYEGGHPDHDATAFAVHTACRLMQAEAIPAPTIIEMTSYHNQSGTMVTGAFLPDTGSQGDVATRVLSEQEQAFKQRLLDGYVTQQHMLRHFSVDVERFRLAPRYDFGQPPHEGPLLYEQFEWGMTGPQWRHLARQALDEFVMNDDRRKVSAKAGMDDGQGGG